MFVWFRREQLLKLPPRPLAHTKREILELQTVGNRLSTSQLRARLTCVLCADDFLGEDVARAARGMRVPRHRAACVAGRSWPNCPGISNRSAVNLAHPAPKTHAAPQPPAGPAPLISRPGDPPLPSGPTAGPAPGPTARPKMTPILNQATLSPPERPRSRASLALGGAERPPQPPGHAPAAPASPARPPPGPPGRRTATTHPSAKLTMTVGAPHEPGPVRPARRYPLLRSGRPPAGNPS